MDIIQAMQQRRSVRSFTGQPLPDEDKKRLMEFASKAYNPFGGNFDIRIKEFDLKGGYKPSTYGMINGAVDFFLISNQENPVSALATGFCFEQVVLKAWQMGYGTCWIAATFKGSDFEKGQKWPDGEQLRIICPVGEAAKKSIKEKLTRATLGSQNRKPFKDLFFDGSFDTPLEQGGRFGQALEMLRIAPSSTNSQPWRAVVMGNIVHFYYVEKSPASILDTGIGICHFWETESFNGQEGEFFQASDAPAAPAKCHYLLSYKAN